jgi:glyoxylase-like metal-dependent hydrolase (beta-lactamase superfamily II)
MRSFKLQAICAVISILMFATASILPAAQDEEQRIKLEPRKLSSNILVLEGGLGRCHLTAVSTEEGIVVIDSLYTPSFASCARKIIEAEFGSSKFVYLINTHGHWDHSFGNQVFADAKIIGHENCAATMQAYHERLVSALDGIKMDIAGKRDQLNYLDPDQEEVADIKKYLDFYEPVVKDLEGDFVLTTPEITFSDKLTFSLGGMTFKLYYYGPSHSDSDILILVPELKLLVTGDLFNHGALVYINPDPNLVDVDRWLAVLDEILSDGVEIEYIVPGHRDLLTRDDLALNRDYFRTLWDGLKAARAEGLSFEQAKERFAFEAKFAHQAGLIHTYQGDDYHLHNIEVLWHKLEGESQN